MNYQLMRQARRYRNPSADMIVEWIKSWSDEQLALEIERIAASAVDGKFDSELTGKRYAVLLLERERRKLARAR